MRARRKTAAQPTTSKINRRPKARALRNDRPVIAAAPAALPALHGKGAGYVRALTADHPELLTRPEAAEFLKCSLRHITYCVARGIITPLRYGDLVRFTRTDLLEAGRKAADYGR